MPSVVTIGVTPTLLTRKPVTSPAASAAPKAYTSAVAEVFPLSPSG